MGSVLRPVTVCVALWGGGAVLVVALAVVVAPCFSVPYGAAAPCADATFLWDAVALFEPRTTGAVATVVVDCGGATGSATVSSAVFGDSWKLSNRAPQ